MTTLELLNEIEKAPAFMGGNERYKSVAGSDILYKQDIEQVRKDLELLSRFKRICYVAGNGIIIHGTMDDYEKIKEWLYEDDNNY